MHVQAGRHRVRDNNSWVDTGTYINPPAPSKAYGIIRNHTDVAVYQLSSISNRFGANLQIRQLPILTSPSPFTCTAESCLRGIVADSRVNSQGTNRAIAV